MYLKITEPNIPTRIRTDFTNCEYDATKIVIDNLRGIKEPIAPEGDQVIELITQHGVVVTTLKVTKMKEFTELQLYEAYELETGKKPSRVEKGVAKEYRDYSRWLAKLKKGLLW